MTPLRFIKTAVRDYRVGALTRSSPFVVDAILRALPSRTTYAVEYGPGDGVVTKRLVQALPPHGRLLAIERNSQFIPELARINDPRLIAVVGDVVEQSRSLRSTSIPQVDAVISGIPCTLLKPEARERLVRQTHASLAPHGVFLVYQYSLLMRPLLARYFRRVRTVFIPLNFPPYFLMVAEK